MLRRHSFTRGKARHLKSQRAACHLRARPAAAAAAANLRRRAGVGAPIEQKLDDIEVPVLRGRHQAGDAVLGGRGELI